MTQDIHIQNSSSSRSRSLPKSDIAGFLIF